MTAKILERTLRAFHRRAPFRPFSAALVNGDSIAIDLPEALILRGGAVVFVAADGTPALFDHESVSAVFGGRPAARN